MLTSKEIRRQFIDFFKEKDHKVVKSAPVVPMDDPTLLFTNAGMNQFKEIFLGNNSVDYQRAVDSQKCIRAGGKHNDLEEVGVDDFHHTFFEMLGNWSFGDYYKAEAIKWAWELITQVWKIPKEKLYATIHYEDEESYDLWQNVTDIKKEKILRFGDKDNFWEMGETGPCGPCSEIHYDRGVEHCSHVQDENHICEVNGDCGRYVEIWNLVFMQFNRLEDGEMVELPKKHVDTGAGFERIVAILQNKYSNYETDIFTPILEKLADLCGKQFAHYKKEFRVISDHIRTLVFAIADGVIPSNLGRGYVIRRILRRAFRFGRNLDLHEPFLYQLYDSVVEVMGEHYPEIKEKRDHIQLTIKSEEERFNKTLDLGLEKFQEITHQMTSGAIISGKDAFKLYDTFGFPIDLTHLLAEEKGLRVDTEKFESEMKKQKQRARKNAQFDMEEDKLDQISIDNSTSTNFEGFSEFKTETKLEHSYLDEENTAILILNKTPFYAEAGGQISDIGRIYNENFEVKVTDVQKKNNVFFHFGKLTTGEIKGEIVTAKIDQEHRKDVARNHTATHILHYALRQILGKHLHQKGSLVAADRLRFDFTHYEAVSEEDLKKIEELANKVVRKNILVSAAYDDLESAKEKGAMALFGEKYEDRVRVIKIGDYSLELCGGTHCRATGEIGLIQITSESSISAGVRRIEAVTGKHALDYVNEHKLLLKKLFTITKSEADTIIPKINKLKQQNKKFGKQIESLKTKSINQKLDELINNANEIQGITTITAKINIGNSNQMRESADYIRQKIKSGIAVLASVEDGSISLICMVTDNLKRKYPAGKIVQKLSKIIGGGGGGKPDIAMGGGSKIDKLDTVFEKLPEIINEFSGDNNE